jgi:hypothetical protein
MEKIKKTGLVNFISPENRALFEIMWYNQTGHRWQYNMAHAYCMLDSKGYRHTLTYLLTPRSRVLLEKLTVNFAASQEIFRIYGTRKFLTVTTSARHLSLS